MKHWNEWRDSVAKVGAFFLGLGSFTYGAWLIYRPIGYLVAGILCVLLSLILDKASDKDAE